MSSQKMIKSGWAVSVEEAFELLKHVQDENAALRAEIERLKLKNNITHDKGILKGFKRAFDICYKYIPPHNRKLAEDTYIKHRDAINRDIEQALSTKGGSDELV